MKLNRWLRWWLIHWLLPEAEELAWSVVNANHAVPTTEGMLRQMARALLNRI